MEMTSDAETEPGGRRAQRQDAGETNDHCGPLYFNQVQRVARTLNAIIPHRRGGPVEARTEQGRESYIRMTGCNSTEVCK